jgi:dGTPase
MMEQEDIEVEAGGKTALRGLLDRYFHAAGKNPDDSKLLEPLEQAFAFEGEAPLPEEYLKVQRVVDYVAGMTDRFAIGLYQQLSGMSL